MAEFARYRAYWRYFLSIERQLVETRRFCQICQDNETAYSDEYVKVILQSSVHFENVAKSWLDEKQPGGKSARLTMDDVRTRLYAMRPGVSEMNVPVIGTDITVNPLTKWKQNEKTDWWDANNKLKHDYLLSFKLGNQRNALHATAGCMIMLLYFFENDIPDIEPHPELFYYERPPYLLGFREEWQKLP